MTAQVGQQTFFAIVPVAVIYDTDLKHTDVRVYATLSERAGTKRRAWPGVRRIATDLGMSPTTVQSAIERLEARGHIEIDRKRGRSNTYWLPMPGVSNSGTPAYQEMTRAVPETDTELEEGTRPIERTQRAPFESFHRDRAEAEVARQKRAGIQVKSDGALMTHLLKADDFVAESRRIWWHRDCTKCAGAGFVSVYAPGAGSTQIECTTVERNGTDE